MVGARKGDSELEARKVHKERPRMGELKGWFSWAIREVIRGCRHELRE